MAKRLLIFGGSGLVGTRFIELTQDKYEIISPSHSELDLLDEQSVRSFVSEMKPDVILNLVAYTNVDGAEEEKGNTNGTVYKLNVQVPKTLALIAKEKEIYLIHISTDYVFNGEKDDLGYSEDDSVDPLNWYGQTKYDGERTVLQVGGKSLIARIEMPYCSKYDRKKDFARFFYETLKAGQKVKAVQDQKITPVFVDDLVKAFEALIEKKELGIIHLASSDYTSPFEFAVNLAEAFGFDKGLIEPVGFEDFNGVRKAPRPVNSWLSIEKFESIYGKGILRSTKEAILSFKQQINS